MRRTKKTDLRFYLGLIAGFIIALQLGVFGLGLISSNDTSCIDPWPSVKGDYVFPTYKMGCRVGEWLGEPV